MVWPTALAYHFYVSGQLPDAFFYLALLIVDMPGKWQDQFLRPGPWPEAFVKAMREAYLRAGPDFQLSKMAPRPLDLGPVATLTSLSMGSFRKMAVIWLGFALVLVAVFILMHWR